MRFGYSLCLRNDDTIAWYENNGANPTFTKAGLVTSADNANDVQVADLDGDGDLDIVLPL